MSPWRMMNEWGIPQVEIFSLLYEYVKKIDEKGEYVPDIAIAGGFTLEDQIFKGLSMGAPYFKIIGMARSPLAAAMVGKTLGKSIEAKQMPVYAGRFGTTLGEVFITGPELMRKFGDRFNEIPPGALGVYTYAQRLAQGMRQLMCGNRKFALEHITRDDIASLTKEAYDISKIPYVMDTDKAEVDRILSS